MNPPKILILLQRDHGTVLCLNSYIVGQSVSHFVNFSLPAPFMSMHQMFKTPHPVNLFHSSYVSEILIFCCGGYK